MQQQTTTFYAQCSAAEAAAREGNQAKVLEALKVANEQLKELGLQAKRRMEPSSVGDYQDQFQRTLTVCRSWLKEGKTPHIFDMVSRSPSVSSNFTVLYGTGNSNSLKW